MTHLPTREQYLQRAWNAATRAATLAQHAESAAHSSDRHKTPDYVAAGAMWADVARTLVIIAEALPEPQLGNETEDTDA